MKERTIQLIVKIIVEVAEWLKILLKDKKEKEDKRDSKGNSREK